mmetsp:Transcript_9099/g.20375  ORF Transcript_9099/g.20375 Transcript_9099/m.20375 type:complete len:172 (-) Transcript_9099:236-751(-)
MVPTVVVGGRTRTTMRAGPRAPTRTHCPAGTHMDASDHGSAVARTSLIRWALDRGMAQRLASHDTARRARALSEHRLGRAISLALHQPRGAAKAQRPVRWHTAAPSVVLATIMVPEESHSTSAQLDRGSATHLRCMCMCMLSGRLMRLGSKAERAPRFPSGDEIGQAVCLR